MGYNLFLIFLIVVLVLGVWAMIESQVDLDGFAAKSRNFLARLGLVQDRYQNPRIDQIESMDALHRQRYDHLDSRSQALLQKMKEDQSQVIRNYQDQLRDLENRTRAVPTGTTPQRINSALESPVSAGGTRAAPMVQSFDEREQFLLDDRAKREQVYRDQNFSASRSDAEEQQRRIREEIQFKQEQLDQIRDSQQMMEDGQFQAVQGDQNQLIDLKSGADAVIGTRTAPVFQDFEERERFLLEDRANKEQIYRDQNFSASRREIEEQQRRIREDIESRKQQLDQIRENQQRRYQDLIDSQSNLQSP